MTKPEKVSDAEKQAIRDQRQARNAHLASIIRPVKAAERNMDYPWPDIEHYLTRMGTGYGGLDMDPDFQRGHKWTLEQQVRFIESALRGAAPRNSFMIQFNCPNWNEEDIVTDLPRGLQCIDGLQRYTAVQAFMRGEIQPFGLTLEDLQGSSFSPDRIHFHVGIFVFLNKVDLLNHYLDFNGAGVAHEPAELDRVRAMRDALTA
jgi:hypothetical protein